MSKITKEQRAEARKWVERNRSFRFEDDGENTFTLYWGADEKAGEVVYVHHEQWAKQRWMVGGLSFYSIREAFAAVSDGLHERRIAAMPTTVVVRPTRMGLRKILDGQEGMVFMVDKFTNGLLGPVAHVRDYRSGQDSHKGFTIWSLPYDEYEVVS